MRTFDTPIRAVAAALVLGLLFPTAPAAAQGEGAPSAPVPKVGTLGGPSRKLSGSELAMWKRGRALFDKDFHRSEGLGTPELNADSCRACHQDPIMGGAGGLELNVTRFGTDGGGGGPFSDLPGGQGLSKLRPPYVAGREEHDPGTADVFEQRQTPTAFGLGAIASISEAEILLRADPLDIDGDGIRGTARLIDVGTGVPEVGRFGWKAQVPAISDFVRDAMANECGITTPDDGRGFALAADGDGVADPELPQPEVDDLTFFLAHLAPPPRGGSQDPMVSQGELLFEMVGCTDCHVPTLAGSEGPVNLFSDLLCHEVMPPGFRGVGEVGAGVGVYRTPPLWGLRHTAPYMHDGRAETPADAILAHDGEAAPSRDAYVALSGAEQAALIAFLQDL